MPPLYCKPSENVAADAAWTVVSGAANSEFPVTKVNNRDPADPTKSTGNGYAIRATFASAQQIEVIQFLMHNLGGTTITLTNNAGLNTTLVVPANTSDEFPVFAWKDLRDDPNNSATQWTFTMTVATGIIHVGEIALWETARFMPILWGAKFGPRRLSHENKTDWGYQHFYDRGIRERTLDGSLIDGDYLDAMLDLEADAHGRVKQWPFIKDEEETDSYWVRFAEDKFTAGKDAPRIAPMDFKVEETGLGLAP